MTRLDDRYLDVVRTLSEELRGTSIEWALTGRTSFAIQGVPLDPNDVGVQTTERGVRHIEERFFERIRGPVAFVESPGIKSYLGELELNGISVEIIGDVRKRRDDGSWEPPVDIAAHREVAEVKGLCVPVLSLDYEARAYEQLGRSERASLLREHLD